MTPPSACIVTPKHSPHYELLMQPVFDPLTDPMLWPLIQPMLWSTTHPVLWPSYLLSLCYDPSKPLLCPQLRGGLTTTTVPLTTRCVVIISTSFLMLTTSLGSANMMFGFINHDVMDYCSVGPMPGLPIEYLWFTRMYFAPEHSIHGWGCMYHMTLHYYLHSTMHLMIFMVNVSHNDIHVHVMIIIMTICPFAVSQFRVWWAKLENLDSRWGEQVCTYLQTVTYTCVDCSCWEMLFISSVVDHKEPTCHWLP